MSEPGDFSLMDLFREELRTHTGTLNQGLVELDFDKQVAACTDAKGLASALVETGNPANVYMRHLILSLEDRDGFMEVVRSRVKVGS